MPPASLSRYGDRSPMRRAASIVLTVAAHLLLAWLLLRLAPALSPPSDTPPLSTFDVAPPTTSAAPTPRARTESRRSPAGGAPRAAPAPRPTPPRDRPAPPPPTPAADLGLLPLDFDLRNAPRSGTGEGAGAGAARGDSVAAYGPGAGPGGDRLYNAEWQREPSSSELNGYLPAGVPPGAWAMIACRAAPGNRVENCRILGEGPPGSGIARAMRQAAWQFRVLPPRRGGEPIIGAWVRIRFDWTTGELRTR